MFIIIFQQLILIAQNSSSELPLSGLHHANALGVRNGIEEVTQASMIVLEVGNSSLIFSVITLEMVVDGITVLSYICLLGKLRHGEVFPCWLAE